MRYNQQRLAKGAEGPEAPGGAGTLEYKQNAEQNRGREFDVLVL